MATLSSNASSNSGSQQLGDDLCLSSLQINASNALSHARLPPCLQDMPTPMELQDAHNMASLKSMVWKLKKERRELEIAEVEAMKGKFSKLLLGEDMSGGGRGVCTALAISNSITNLAASVFGELWRLEPLAPERKMMWHREMEWLLSVTDHIVELVPQWQKCSDGSSTEVVVSSPRSDLQINLPALRKLDALLLEMLDSFTDTEFWYSDAVNTPLENKESVRSLHRQREKWWLPTPNLHVNGLSDESKKCLQQQREVASQILKAAMSINAQVLSEMEVPDAYLECLPRNGKTSLGEFIYHNLSSEEFSPEALLSRLDLSSEHIALELANSIEVAIQVWMRKIYHKQLHTSVSKTTTKSWRNIMKDLVVDSDRRHILVDRAETLLVTLKQRFPGLPQTSLDTSKIQFNRDVGQAILESYSRVLESLAFNILSRIDDVLDADANRNEISANSFACATPMRDHNPTLNSDCRLVDSGESEYVMESVAPEESTTVVKPPVTALPVTQTGETVQSASSTDHLLSDHMKVDILAVPGHFSSPYTILQKFSSMEVNNWSLACNLGNGKAHHSPLGRD